MRMKKMKKLLFNPKISKADALYMKRLMNRHPETIYRDIFSKANESYRNVSEEAEKLKVTEDYVQDWISRSK